MAKDTIKATIAIKIGTIAIENLKNSKVVGPIPF